MLRRWETPTSHLFEAGSWKLQIGHLMQLVPCSIYSLGSISLWTAMKFILEIGNCS